MKNLFWQTILKNGLYAGGILAGYFLLQYLLNVNVYSWFTELISFLLNLVVVLVFSFVAISQIRKSTQDRRLSYQHAFFTALGVSLICLLLSYIINILIMYVVDYDYNISCMKESMLEMSELTNNDPNAMNQYAYRLEQIENFNLLSALYGIAALVLQSVIISAIVALIARKKDRLTDSLNA